MGPPPPNYLVQAILATLFCCLPFGIVSIVYAAQVSSKWALGDYQGAMSSSRSARTWAWASFAAGIAIVVVYVIVIAIAASSSHSTITNTP